MKYRLLQSEKLPVPNEEKKIIYMIPLSSSQKHFAVIYPDCPVPALLESIARGTIELRRFMGCPDEAVHKVKQALGELIRREIKTFAAKQSSKYFLGILLIGFGIIDFFLPDPVIFLDEILIIAGGGWILSSGIKLKKIHNKLKSEEEACIKRISQITVNEDPLCSGIFASIQAKDELLIKELREDFSIDSLKDRIEVETRWFVDYIKIEELIQNKQVRKTDVKNIMNGIGCILPLKKIVILEEKIHKRMVKGKSTHKLSGILKKMKKQIMENSGFSDDAITVYSEFYKSAAAYFAAKGETL
ncbi:MAG: hypothetical protein JXJ04_08000 [Spirochaetales bacterium]|nr:hypothetical protein [Spirochaetales bacterium]